MKNLSSIRNKNIIPDTHCFLYKDKKYPFKFDFFKYASDYFSSNQEKYLNIKSIPLDDLKTENIKLTEESIQLFINYVQGEEITLSNDNVFPINFLSKKYEVKSLQKYTKEYISNHHKELIIELLQTDTSNLPIETDDYEEIISANLIDYIQDDCLLNLSIPILYRILSKYKSIQKVQKSEEDQEKVVEFCFKCLKKFGREASALFSHVDLVNATNGHLNRLLNDYSNIFDFHFIDSSLLRTIYQTNCELIRRDKENEKFRSDVTDMMSKLRDDMTRCLQKIEEQGNEIQSRKKEIEKINIDHCNELKSLKDEINQLQTILKQNNENHSRSIKSLNERMEKNEKEKEELKQNNENHSESIKSLNERMEKVEKEKLNIGVPLLHEQRGDFNGIIKYLTNKAGGNIHDRNIIAVTSNSFQSGWDPKNLLNFSTGGNGYASGNNDFWVLFDFNDMKVKITSYSIKSYKLDQLHLKSWDIEVSDNGQSWTSIDERRDCSELNGSLQQVTFNTRNNNFSRYVRIINRGAPWGDQSWTWFYWVEFYGYLKE